jgi:hypothetical protein
MTPADDRGQAAGNDDPGELLAVGDLARATGLTVRTLHHYDRLGLLPPLRDAGGRRRYGPAEARRLHQIIALRASACRWRRSRGCSKGRDRIRCRCCGGSWPRPRRGSPRRSGCGTRYWR